MRKKLELNVLDVLCGKLGFDVRLVKMPLGGTHKDKQWRWGHAFPKNEIELIWVLSFHRELVVNCPSTESAWDRRFVLSRIEQTSNSKTSNMIEKQYKTENT